MLFAWTALTFFVFVIVFGFAVGSVDLFLLLFSLNFSFSFCGFLLIQYFLLYCIACIIFTFFSSKLLFNCALLSLLVLLFFLNTVAMTDTHSGLSSNVAQKSAEVMVVFQDSHQTFPTVLMKWCVSVIVVIKGCPESYWSECCLYFLSSKAAHCSNEVMNVLGRSSSKIAITGFRKFYWSDGCLWLRKVLVKWLLSQRLSTKTAESAARSDGCLQHKDTTKTQRPHHHHQKNTRFQCPPHMTWGKGRLAMSTMNNLRFMHEVTRGPSQTQNFHFTTPPKQKRRQISSTTTTKPQMFDNNPKCLTTTLNVWQQPFTTVITSVEVWAMLANITAETPPQKHHPLPQKHHHNTSTKDHRKNTTGGAPGPNIS